MVSTCSGHWQQHHISFDHFITVWRYSHDGRSHESGSSESHKPFRDPDFRRISRRLTATDRTGKRAQLAKSAPEESWDASRTASDGVVVRGFAQKQIAGGEQRDHVSHRGQECKDAGRILEISSGLQKRSAFRHRTDHITTFSKIPLLQR